MKGRRCNGSLAEPVIVSMQGRHAIFARKAHWNPRAGILLTGLLLILLLVVAGLAGFFAWDVYLTQASG